MTDEEKKPPDKPPSPWTPEMVKTILEGITPLGNRFIDLKEKEFANKVEMEKAVSRSSWWVLFVFMVFLAVIIALMVSLVFAGRVSGDALLFLVGTVAGYVMSIVQRHLFPEVIEVPQE